jgi:hypothetical protein
VGGCVSRLAYVVGSGGSSLSAAYWRWPLALHAYGADVGRFAVAPDSLEIEATVAFAIGEIQPARVASQGQSTPP